MSKRAYTEHSQEVRTQRIYSRFFLDHPEIAEVSFDGQSASIKDISYGGCFCDVLPTLKEGDICDVTVSSLGLSQNFLTKVLRVTDNGQALVFLHDQSSNLTMLKRLIPFIQLGASVTFEELEDAYIDSSEYEDLNNMAIKDVKVRQPHLYPEDQKFSVRFDEGKATYQMVLTQGDLETSHNIGEGGYLTEQLEETSKIDTEILRKSILITTGLQHIYPKDEDINSILDLLTAFLSEMDL